jgi:acyl-CoA dehydrogenase
MNHSSAVAAVAQAAQAHAKIADQRAEFPCEALAQMRQTGLLGLCVPQAYGGWDGGPAELVQVALELGRADMSVALIFVMHCQQVAVVARHGHPKLRAEVLPAIAHGEIYLASVTTEASGGGNLFASDSPVIAAEGKIAIDRHAPIVTGGEHADGFLITTRAPDAASPTVVDLLYAARDQLSVEVLGGWQPMGMRATASIPLRLRGSVPDWQVIGERGGFPDIAAELFAPLAHLGWAAAWLGTAAGACSATIRYLRSSEGRRRFDAGSELLLSRIAAVRGRLDVVHAVLEAAVRAVSSGRDLAAPPAQLLLNTLKVVAAEECFQAVHELIDVVGVRHGYLADSPLGLERAFRDLRSAAVNYSNDRLRLASGTLALRDMGVHFA